jgi:DNA-binding transcriptional LysR family regulator
MELRDLRYFVAVASELHFARAAQRLFISQPALSQQIRRLEGELGLRLLERNSRGVQLTPEGAAFLREAKIVVRAADHASDVARALAEGATGHVRLGHLRTMPRGLPERVVNEYRRRYPGVEIIAESGSTEQNVERVRDGQLDLAFLLAPLENAPELGCVEITKEPVVVAIPSSNPLSRRRRIRRQDLVGVPLVYFPRHNSPGFYDSSLWQMYGDVAPEIVRTEPNEEQMLIAVSEGAGITMLLRGRTATLRFPGVVYRPFAPPEPTGLLALAFHQPPSLPTRRFLDLAVEVGREPASGARARS